MKIKQEKLKQLLRKILKEQDCDNLTLGNVKRLLEGEIGLEEGDLDSQTIEIKEILTQILNENSYNDEEKVSLS
jgi:hypothetical protein